MRPVKGVVHARQGGLQEAGTVEHKLDGFGFVERYLELIRVERKRTQLRCAGAVGIVLGLHSLT